MIHMDIGLALPTMADGYSRATTLEWATPTPPPHGNFPEPPVVYCGPYEYSVPGTPRDFSPQFVKQGG